MNKIAIIGGAGFIGTKLNRYLRSKGCDIRVFDIKDNSIDVTRPSTYYNLIDYNPDYIFHFAAKMRMSDFHPSPKPGWDVNVTGLINTLECCNKLTNLKRVIFSSTVHVYSATNDTTVDEDTVLSHQPALHPYALSKITGEDIIKSYNLMNGLNYTILRFGVVYGPEGHSDMVLHKFIQQSLADTPVTITGNTTRCFVYIDDLIQALYKCIESDKIDNQTINCCYDYSVSIMNLIKMLRLSSFFWTESRVGDFNCPTVSNNKAKILLNWSPETTLEQGIENCKNWYVANK